MTDRRALDAAFRRHPAVGSEPRGGKGHPHRRHAVGLKVEARILAAALLRRARPEPFLIYARPRSGTTLLVQLLQQVPDITCSGELMHSIIASPRLLLRTAPMTARRRAYGFKVLSYQLTEVQRVLRPLAFFDDALGLGYRLIHLRRGTYEQTLSLVKAQMLQQYHLRPGETARAAETEIDPARFVEMLQWNARMLEYEDAVMAELPHLRLQYEDDLRAPERHQPTVDRICEALGLPSGPVRATLVRTGGEDGRIRVRNMDALREAAERAGFAPGT